VLGITVTVAVFTSPPDAALYYAVYGLWILSFLVENAIIRGGGGKAARTRSDRGSGLLILLTVFVSILVASGFAKAGIALLPVQFFYLGLLLMVLGIALRLWAVSTLRGFFSYTVQIKVDHRILESGPYRFVRHPAYSGSLLAILGVGFALQSWGAVLLMAAFFGAAFGYRIRVEESALRASLGEEYIAYSKRVRRLIPWVF
jgi:protein-S-isoprenylcysteine O-methyltransferase Ste14